MLRRPSLFSLALAFVALPALAHPEHGGAISGMGAGLIHPLLGVDHVLAMLAVGLWARVLGGKAVWMLPGAFVLGVAMGFALALAGVHLPAVEVGVAASVVLLGVLLGAAGRPPLAAAMALAGLFAVLHGHAHGSEFTGAAPAFAKGLLASTAVLHAAGIGLGGLLMSRRQVALTRGVGAAVAGIGLVLLGAGA